jgi:MFS transporter, YNFM family, putative membrane transport protein
MSDVPSSPAVAASDSPAAWHGHAPGSPAYRRILLGLFCAGVATFAQLYSFQAILPEFGLALGIDEASAALTVSAATLGVAASVLPWASVADRIGRVPAMIVSVSAATLLGIVALAFDSLPLIAAVRLLEGMALGGVPAIAIAYLNEEVAQEHAVRASAIYVAGTSIGGLSGRLVSGPVTEATGSWRLGVAAVIVLCATAAVVFMTVIPRARGFIPLRRRPAALPPDARVRHLIRRHLQDGRLRALFGIAFLLMGGFVAVYNYLGFRLMQPPYDLPQTAVSLLFLAYLLGTLSSSVAGGVAARHGRRAVLVAATALMLAGAAVTLLQPLWAVLAGLLLFTAGFFAAHAIASGWVGALAERGRAQAGSMYNLFYYGGSSVLGWAGGLALRWLWWPGVVGMVALGLVLALLLARRLRGVR